MKNKKDIEKILLNDSEYDKMVKAKIEKEFEQEINSSAKSENDFITDIKLVPVEKLFTKATIFEVLNKASKTKSYINGLQADGYLGSQNSDREKLLSGQTDSFISGSSYVKFVKSKA